MDRSGIARFFAVSSVYLLSGIPLGALAQMSSALSSRMAAATVAETAPAPQSMSRVAERLTANFTGFAGSKENAASLVNGLRSGSLITLSSGASNTSAGGNVSFMPSTSSMGWINVQNALTLAQRELTAAGITKPTPDQLRAALLGGTVVGGSRQTVSMPGVLTLRSQGMGWGRIASTLDVPLGRAATAASNHGTPGTVAGGHPVGAATTAHGEIMHSRQWSNAGSSRGLVDTDAKVTLSSPMQGRSALRVGSSYSGVGFDNRQ